MAESGKDEVSVEIDKLVYGFSYTASTPLIYRVSECLRSTKEKAYDPKMIAIGPFHHGKHHLQAMEPLKLRYLQRLLGGSTAHSYVQAIRSNEQSARDFYAENIKLTADELVKMLLLDGIFIIQFLRDYNNVDLRKQESKGDPIFGFQHVVSDILRDLMLFENQIPMFIVIDLFKMSNRDNQELKDLLWPFLQHRRDVKAITVLPDAHHLLGLVHAVKFCSSVQQLTRRNGKHSKMENIHSATELRDAGIIFKKKPENEDPSLLDITFKNKTIYITKLEMTDEMESWLRNMIAYEFYLPTSKPRYISDYAYFLQCLMSSPKDAELLRRCGVISNCLGGDARVYEVIDRLGTNVFTSENFLYSHVFDSINIHCKRKRNRWLAVLRRHHFNNPWTAISLVAAAVLLSVGIVQMLFAVLSFYHD